MPRRPSYTICNLNLIAYYNIRIWKYTYYTPPISYTIILSGVSAPREAKRTLSARRGEQAARHAVLQPRDTGPVQRASEVFYVENGSRLSVF